MAVKKRYRYVHVHVHDYISVNFTLNYTLNCALLQQLWVGVMQHVCGDHHWAEGQCQHEPMSDPGEGKEWLDPSSTAAETLRDMVFDRKWLSSLSYYVHNRHTGTLEVSIV